MITKTKSLIVAFAILAVSAGFVDICQAAPTSAQTLVWQFCNALKKADEKAIAKTLTPDLQKLIAAANKSNAAWAKKNANEKPPLGDGIPYQSYPDTSPICEPGELVKLGDGAGIEVRHIFPGQVEANWKDRLVLKNTNNGLKIDDVLFATMDNAQGLRYALREAFKKESSAAK